MIPIIFWIHPKKVEHANWNKYNTTNIESVAIICDRYGISDRAGAAIATSALQSVSGINPMLVFDKNKTRRAREKASNKLTAEKCTNVIGVFFDGRKDSTTYLKKHSDGFIQSTKTTEKHISIIGEPGQSF